MVGQNCREVLYSHAPCIPAAYIYDLKSEDLRVRAIITLPANPVFPKNGTDAGLGDT